MKTKVYFIHIGVQDEHMSKFFGMMFSEGISFGFSYEDGEIGVTGIQSDFDTIDTWLEENNLTDVINLNEFDEYGE